MLKRLVPLSIIPLDTSFPGYGGNYKRPIYLKPLNPGQKLTAHLLAQKWKIVIVIIQQATVHHQNIETATTELIHDIGKATLHENNREKQEVRMGSSLSARSPIVAMSEHHLLLSMQRPLVKELLRKCYEVKIWIVSYFVQQH